MKTNVYKRFDPRVMEREECIGINGGLPTMLITVFVLISFKTNVFFTIVIIIVIWKSNFKYYYNLKRSWFGVSFAYYFIDGCDAVILTDFHRKETKQNFWGDVCVRKIIKHRWQVKIEKSQTPKGKISIVLWLERLKSYPWVSEISRSWPVTGVRFY